MARLLDPQQLNRYAYRKNNPLRFIDPDGRSTHANRYGDVLAVYNDGDLEVYRHWNITNDYDGRFLSNRGPGVEWVGETWRWDEFAAHDRKGEAFERPEQGARIMFGLSFDEMMTMYERIGDGMSSGELLRSSGNGGMLDIKLNTSWAPFGPATGGLLFGKYITAESAGNYLAGHNAARLASEETTMRMAGAIHLEKGVFGAALAWFGKAYAPGPNYGEIPFAAYWIRWGYIRGSLGIR